MILLAFLPLSASTTALRSVRHACAWNAGEGAR